MNYYKFVKKNSMLFALVYALVFVLFLYGASVIIAKSDYENIGDTYSSEFSKNIYSAANYVDDVMRIFEHSEEIRGYVTAQEPDGSQIMEARTYLSSKLSLLPVAEGSIGITTMENNHIVTKDSTMNFDYYCKSMGMPVSKIQSTAKQLKENERNNTAVFISKKAQKSYITFIKYNNSDFEKGYYVYAAFEINKLHSNTEKNCFFSLLIDGDIVYNSADMQADKISKIVYDNNVIYKSIEYNSGISNIGHDIRAVYSMPVSRYFMLNNKRFYIILLLFCLIMFISWFMINHITRSIYAPMKDTIKKIKSKNIQTENEFDAINRTIDNLELEKKNMIDIVDNYRQSNKYMFLRNVLNGLYHDKEIERGIKEYAIPTAFTELRVAIINYTNYAQISDNLSDEGKYVFGSEIKNLIEQYMSHCKYYEYIEKNITSAIIIISVENMQELRKRFIDLIYQIEFDFGIKSYAIIGMAVNSIYNINKSYRVANEFLENNFYIGNDQPLFFARDFESETDEYDTFYNDSMLIQSIRECNNDLMHEEVKKIIARNYRDNYISHSHHVQLSIVFISIAIKVISSLGKKETDIFPEKFNLYLEVNAATSRQSLYEKVIYIFDTIINSIEEKKNENKIESFELTDFIGQNYMKDISLLDLAEHMNLTMQYTSKVFKDYVGENFKTYLGKYRVEMAKKIISENPEKKLSDIAAMVGCNNTDTFIRLFQKYEGITPAKYRMRF